MIRISWTDNAGWSRYQDFVCSSEIIENMYVNNESTVITVRGMSANQKDVTVTLIATSELGVEVFGVPHKIILSSETN